MIAWSTLSRAIKWHPINFPLRRGLNEFVVLQRGELSSSLLNLSKATLQHWNSILLTHVGLKSRLDPSLVNKINVNGSTDSNLNYLKPKPHIMCTLQKYPICSREAPTLSSDFKNLESPIPLYGWASLGKPKGVSPSSTLPNFSVSNHIFLLRPKISTANSPSSPVSICILEVSFTWAKSSVQFRIFLGSVQLSSVSMEAFTLAQIQARKLRSSMYPF